MLYSGIFSFIFYPIILIIISFLVHFRSAIFQTLKTKKLHPVVLGNGQILLVCVTEANPPASQYRFYREGVYIGTSLTGTHVIPKARYSDAGTYDCVPINLLGTGANTSVTVVVIGR